VHASQTLGLFVATALAELGGCYLVFLWLRRGGSGSLALAAAALLAAFAWLLTQLGKAGVAKARKRARKVA
jgi:small multidrug resistance family-3 protein